MNLTNKLIMSDKTKPFQFKGVEWEFPNAKEGQIKTIVDFCNLNKDFEDIEVLNKLLCETFKLKLN
jgi:hypothetical protein